MIQITNDESSVEPLTWRQRRGLYLVFLIPELDLAELASPWLPADHAARKESVARDKRWRRCGNSGKPESLMLKSRDSDLALDGP